MCPSGTRVLHLHHSAGGSRVAGVMRRTHARGMDGRQLLCILNTDAVRKPSLFAVTTATIISFYTRYRCCEAGGCRRSRRVQRKCTSSLRRHCGTWYAMDDGPYSLLQAAAHLTGHVCM